MNILWMLAILVVAVLAWRRWTNPFRGEELYRLREDGAESALYRRRERLVTGSGYRFCAMEFQRVTCVPGQRYTAPTSDWFNTRGPSGKTDCHFVRLKVPEVKRMLAAQLPATRRLAWEHFLRRITASLACDGLQA